MFITRFFIINGFILLWNLVIVGKGLARERKVPRSIWALSAVILILHVTEVILLLQSLGTSSPEKFFYLHFWPFWVMFGLAALQNLLVLRSFRWKRFGIYPLLAYNVLISGSVFLFWLNLQPGLVLPVFLQTIVRNYIRMQEVWFLFFAIFLPSFHFFPILSIPWGVRFWPKRTTAIPAQFSAIVLRGVTAIACMAFMISFLWNLPRSYRDVVSHSLDTPVEMASRPDLNFAANLQIQRRGPFEDRLKYYENELDYAEEIGLGWLVYYMATDFMEEEERFKEFEKLFTLARGRGFKIIMAFDTAADWIERPAADIPDEEYERRVREACIRAATDFHPDGINPVVEPFGAQTIQGKRDWPPERWRDFLSNVAEAIHAIAPDIRVGTNVSSISDPREEELFRMLCEPSCPLDAPGMSINTGIGPLEEVLMVYTRRLKMVPPEKIFWIYEFAVTPLISGQGAQAKYIRRVAAWAASHPEVSGISFYPMSDYAEIMGLVGFGRFKRSGFTAYQEVIRQVHKEKS